ncbi:MAG TPA: MarR family winged helix-turn-helix transcriptional regulator [Ramlibacter sp.]|nr:MarR family winged helix-turn-helix transcriptional regulator [Ramlibacter sp.]
MPTRILTKPEIEARSAFRQQLREFERSGEDAARSQGITFPQYLVLLHVKGMPGRAWALVGELAEKMLLEHHSVVGLVSRCEAAGLVKRKRSVEDGRQVEVHLTAKGERALNGIAAAQSGELRSLLTYLSAAARRETRPARKAAR